MSHKTHMHGDGSRGSLFVFLYETFIHCSRPVYPDAIPAAFACSPCRSGPSFHPAHENLYFRASDGLVTRPVAGYLYGANWEICTGRTFTCLQG